MADFMEVRPLKILERFSRKGLGRRNLGVLMARAGVGKTACLIHLALDKLFRGEKLVHVSLEDVPEKVISYYNVIFSDLVKALDLDNESEMKMLLERNRMILAYLNQSFEMERLGKNLQNLKEKVGFVPDTMILDGLDFKRADREVFDGFKAVAAEFELEIWLSALSHRHIPHVNERGIPYPCDRFDDFFSIILQLEPTPSGIFLRLLKDHESEIGQDVRVRLDPNTFLPMKNG